MPITPNNVCRYLRPGMVLEITTPHRSILATVSESGRGRVVAQSDGDAPGGGRVMIRVPLDGAMLKATARILPSPTRDRSTVVLDTFANVERYERRASARLSEPVVVRVEGSREELRVLPATNISSNGLLLSWPDRPPIALGERLRLSVVLEDGPMEMTAEVIRADGLRTAVRFTGIAQADRDRIVSYIFRRERERQVIEEPIDGWFRFGEGT